MNIKVCVILQPAFTTVDAMRSPKIYFTAGPSALYFTVEEHLRTAIKLQIPSISHRSKQFSQLYEETEELLRTLVGLPRDYHLFFTASATEVWERILQSCVQDYSLHLVNGAFSKRFYEIAQQLDLNPISISAEPGSVVTPDHLEQSAEPELLAVTHNETSTGTHQPLEHLKELRVRFPDTLIAVDVVSSFPQVELPFETIDSAYFSVQKCLGLPAGLGVWLLNKSCIDKALSVRSTTHTAYHGIASLWEKYQKYQTPATPNVLSIYLLNRVLHDMLLKGIDRIRMEGRYKAAVLYQMLENHQVIQPFVEVPEWRSQTVVVGQGGSYVRGLLEYLEYHGLILSKGYGDFKAQQLRIANFPTHSKEQVELLVDKINAYNG